MELDKLSTVEESVDYEVVLPDGTKTDFVLKVVGIDHPAYKEVDRLITKRNIKKFSDNRGNVNINANKLDLDENRKDEIERVAAAVVGWKGLVHEGKEVKYSKERCLDVLSNDGLSWLVDDLIIFITDRANFMKG